MPITQTRMMALAQAAQTFQLGFERVIAMVRGEIASATKGEKTYQDACVHIGLMLHESLYVNDSHIARSIILEEVKHFEREARSNDRARKRQAQLRTRQPGHLPRTHQHSVGHGQFAQDFQAAIPARATTAPLQLGPQRQRPRTGADLVEEIEDPSKPDFESDPFAEPVPEGIDLSRDPLANASQSERTKFDRELEEALAANEVLERQGLLDVGTPKKKEQE